MNAAYQRMCAPTNACKIDCMPSNKKAKLETSPTLVVTRVMLEATVAKLEVMRAWPNLSQICTFSTITSKNFSQRVA